MATSPPVSEEDLHAFLDGETDAQTNAVILAHLARCPADAARVNIWRSQNELIRAHFNKIEQEPIPLSLSLIPARNLRAETLMRLVPETSGTQNGEEPTPAALKGGDLAKLCAAIGIAFAGGMIAALVTPNVTRPLVQFFPNQPSASSARTADDLPLPAHTLQMARVREKTGFEPINRIKNETPSSQDGLNPAPLLFRDLAALDISIAGFQIGTTPGEPALCLFLTTKPGVPLTLCLAKTETSQASGFRTLEEPPLRSVDWPEKSGHFALAGRMPAIELLDFAHNLHMRMVAADR